MKSKNSVFGHLARPMLIILPLGLFISAVVFDLAFWLSGERVFAGLSYFNISLGIVGGLLAVLFGFFDWLAIPADTHARRMGAWHAAGNTMLVLLFGLSWFLRGSAPDLIPSTLALACSYAGILLGLVTTWLGGELLDGLQVGAERDANLNAPNSLSRKKSRAYRAGRHA